MHKFREILRLKENDGLSNQVIARACKIFNSIIGEQLQRTQQVDLNWPLPEGISEDELYRKLFPEKEKLTEPV